MSLEGNLKKMERCREAYWRRYPNTSPTKLRWRALTVRHSFHVLPGESIPELGAGSGLWTEHLSAVLRGQNPITAAVFNGDFVDSPREIPNVKFVKINDLGTTKWNPPTVANGKVYVGTYSGVNVYGLRLSDELIMAVVSEILN